MDYKSFCTVVNEAGANEMNNDESRAIALGPPRPQLLLPAALLRIHIHLRMQWLLDTV